jgi:hypothetical protein
MKYHFLDGSIKQAKTNLEQGQTNVQKMIDELLSLEKRQYERGVS